MDGIVDPAADTIWGSVAIINGKEKRRRLTPTKSGSPFRRSVLQLVEASNLLQIPGRHVAKPGERNEQGIELQPDQIETLINQDRQPLVSLAHGLHDVATLAINAADAKGPWEGAGERVAESTTPVNAVISNTGLRGQASPTANRGSYPAPVLTWTRCAA